MCAECDHVVCADMPRKKVDNRIRVLVENGIAKRQRSMFAVVGDKGRDQVVILHHMLSKAVVKARPSVLWCYKKELGFSSHRKKRMRQLQKKLKSGTLDVKQDDPFELFVAATNIRYCYYNETHKILGSTYGMCVLQDFEALTPNLLARTIETVEGGGLVVLLIQSVNSLKQLYTLCMDVHARYRTESHHEVVGRFNERFLLSLASCSHCMVIDDQLNLLPLSSHMLNIQPVPARTEEDSVSPTEVELRALKTSLADTQPVGCLLACAKTLDQGKALLKFVEAISEKTLRSTVAMTAARGRGKSAALGLAIAAAVAFGYSNIFVTSPSPENLCTVFEFVFRGFDALHYSEHEDYEAVQSTNPEFNRAIIRVNIFHEHRQTIQYIHPGDSHKLEQAELLCIDEAAAIPLPLVKRLLGAYLVFMASTINGYEGTGRALSLKLIEELRQQNAQTAKSESSTATGRVLREVALNEPIRYASHDPVEAWLHSLLCLDAVPRVSHGCPPPSDCQLYYVNRDTLFCYHAASEEFLHRLVSLYVASHYKNSPNDLQLLSDAPAHQIFVLLGPIDATTTSLPEILCVLQVCLEGEISKATVMSNLSRGKRASGDLIPWTISQQFADHSFASMSGVRVVRIATHPDFQGMGYGSRTMQLLTQYYQGEIPCLSEKDDVIRPPVTSIDEATPQTAGLLSETIAPRTQLPPLLCKLSERPAERMDYLGVAYGLTTPLHRFWKRAGFLPVYLRQTTNELTGEHSCIMLRSLHSEEGAWLDAYYHDFRCRFVSLLSYQFREFAPNLALAVLHSHRSHDDAMSYSELIGQFSKYDLKRLELYSRNMADHHLITDLVPTLARLYFTHKTGFKLSAAQAAILLALGLQHKTVDSTQAEMNLPSSQVMGLFNRTVRKFVQLFTALEVGVASAEMTTPTNTGIDMQPITESVDKELAVEAEKWSREQQLKQEELRDVDLSQYAVTGKESDWDNALGAAGGRPGIVSMARSSRKRKPLDKESNKQKKKRKQ